LDWVYPKVNSPFVLCHNVFAVFTLSLDGEAIEFAVLANAQVDGCPQGGVGNLTHHVILSRNVVEFRFNV